MKIKHYTKLSIFSSMIILAIIVSTRIFKTQKSQELNLHNLFEYRLQITDNVFSPKEFPFMISVAQLLKEKGLSEDAVHSRTTGSDGYEYVSVSNDIKTTSLNEEIKEVYYFVGDMLVTIEYIIPLTKDNKEMVCQNIYNQVILLNLPNQTDFSLNGLLQGYNAYRWEDEQKNRLTIESPKSETNERNTIVISLILSREALAQKLTDK